MAADIRWWGPTRRAFTSPTLHGEHRRLSPAWVVNAGRVEQQRNTARTGPRCAPPQPAPHLMHGARQHRGALRRPPRLLRSAGSTRGAADPDLATISRNHAQGRRRVDRTRRVGRRSRRHYGVQSHRTHRRRRGSSARRGDTGSDLPDRRSRADRGDRRAMHPHGVDCRNCRSARTVGTGSGRTGSAQADRQLGRFRPAEATPTAGRG